MPHLSAPILPGAPLNSLPGGIQTKQYYVQAEYSMLPIDPTNQQWSRLVTLGALTTILAERLALGAQRSSSSKCPRIFPWHH